MEWLIKSKFVQFLMNQMRSSVLLYNTLEKVENISQTQLCGKMFFLVLFFTAIWKNPQAKILICHGGKSPCKLLSSQSPQEFCRKQCLFFLFYCKTYSLVWIGGQNKMLSYARTLAVWNSDTESSIFCTFIFGHLLASSLYKIKPQIIFTLICLIN